MNVQEFAELAAGFALDSLSPDDERAFRAALAEHPEWAGIVAADVETAGRLADAVEEVAPPPGVRSALLARISPDPVPAASAVTEAMDAAPASEPPSPDAAPDAVASESAPRAVPAEPASDESASVATPPSTEAPGPSTSVPAAPSTDVIQTVARRRWTRGLLALAASFVLLIGLGTTAVVIGDRLRAPAEVLALDEIESAPDAQSATVDIEDGGTATAHWSESVGKAVLVTTGLPATGGDETYQLWFVRDGGAVSAGLFEPDEGGSSTTVLDGEVEAGDVIAVTVEPDGGSPTGQPTSDPIFAIPTA